MKVSGVIKKISLGSEGQGCGVQIDEEYYRSWKEPVRQSLVQMNEGEEVEADLYRSTSKKDGKTYYNINAIWLKGGGIPEIDVTKEVPENAPVGEAELVEEHKANGFSIDDQIITCLLEIAGKINEYFGTKK